MSTDPSFSGSLNIFDCSCAVSTQRQASVGTMGEPSYMRKIAADDFYMQLCKIYSDSDSPFGLVDCDTLVASLRDAFAREVTGADFSRMAQQSLLPAIRSFVGTNCAYERELCDILARTYCAADGISVNAAALLEDFAAVLSVRTSPPQAADGRAMLSKVELRHAITSWISEGATAAGVKASSPIKSVQFSPARSSSPPTRVAVAASAPRSRSKSPPARSPPPARDPSPRRPTPQSPRSPQTLAASRAAATALSALIRQAESASRDNERALAEVDELVASWQQRAFEAEAEARRQADAKDGVSREVAQARNELTQTRSELSAALRQSTALEERLTMLERRHAEALRIADEQSRELGSKHRALESNNHELEAALSRRSSELQSATYEVATLREQRWRSWDSNP